jgi:DNA polymerase III subunit delta'
MKKPEVIDIIKPINQLNLYGFNSYFDLFVKLFKKRKIPSINLFNGPAGIGKSTFVYHLINYILSIDETNTYDLEKKKINKKNYSYNLICKNIHPNFFGLTFELKKQDIKVEDIRSLLKFLHKSAFSSSIKCILIDSAEKLNLNSSNALLKILEEPPDNVFFFIVNNSNKKILSTIKSRAHEFKFFLTLSEKEYIFNKIIQDYDIDIDIKKTIKKFYFDTPGSLLKYSLVLSKSNIVFSENIYESIIYLINLYKKDKNIELLHFISLFVEIFYNQLCFKQDTDLNSSLFNKSKILNLFSDMKKYNLNENNVFFSVKDILNNEFK